MQINLTKRHFPGVDWRNIHLNDKSCRATITPNTMNLRTPLNGCGTIYREHNNKIAFWNEVSNDGRGHGPGNGSTITRGNNLVIPFYCEYGRQKIVSTSFSAAKKIVYASEGSYGNFTFTMDLYQTSRYSTPYSPSAYPVVVYPNQPLWVQYEVKNTNADLVVFAENCRATPSNDPNASPQHVFLQRGCINDPTMVYSYDPSSRVQRFSVRSFRFVYSNSFYVYLHCELIVCHRNTTNSRCAQGCINGSRVRRETADGSNAHDLSAGPFRKTNEKTETAKRAEEGSSKASLALIGGLSAVGGLFLLVTILLSVKMLRNRRVPANVTRPPVTTADVTVNFYEQQGVEQDEKVKSNA
ncbi:ZP domain-containing protein-like [Actinia tenebrosa]|uniref:ZP domain-containing protein-like n=1 Tax=Actinia tenebrosa TaxID=6105 RepID=A0A6P8GY02_ACTTE|nr:ZP domain-containing protein-like [Actinia tenebrosa]